MYVNIRVDALWSYHLTVIASNQRSLSTRINISLTLEPTFAILVRFPWLAKYNNYTTTKNSYTISRFHANLSYNYIDICHQDIYISTFHYFLRKSAIYMMSSILCLKGAWQTKIYLCAPLWLIHKLTDAKVFCTSKVW